MQQGYADIQQAGGKVLVISFTPPPLVVLYLKENPQPFAVVSDPERTAYKAFGLEKATVKTFLRLGVLARFVKLMFRGWLPRKPNKGEDIYQLGGDFVLDAVGRVVLAHPSAEPTDRPPVQKLVQAVQAAKN